MAPPPGDAEASVARLNKLQALASRRAPPLRSKNGGLGHATAAASQCSAAPIRSQAPAGAAAAIGSTTLGSSGGGTAAAELTRQEALAQNARLEVKLCSLYCPPVALD